MLWGRIIWYWVQTMLSVLMCFCSARSHLRLIIKNLIRTKAGWFSWQCYPLTEVVSSTPDFINVLPAPRLSRVYPHRISDTRDKYQHPPFICQGLRLDRKKNPSLNVTIPHRKRSPQPDEICDMGHWGRHVSCVWRSVEVNGKWRRKTFCSSFKKASRIRCVAFCDFSLTFISLNGREWRWLPF